MDRCQSIWNARYEKMLQKGIRLWDDRWLEDWLHLVPQGHPRRAFDVGCGGGHNIRLLHAHGFEVKATDYSESALRLCSGLVPENHLVCRDIREGLPFSGEHFELVVADLSLHYFTLEKTAAIIGQIAERLVPGGLFAGRFNSTSDNNYGAGSGEPIPGEPHMYRVDGIDKRFYSQACFGRLFTEPWKVPALSEQTTRRFGAPKVLWEVAALRE